MNPPISGTTMVAGVAGAPVAHSLSPIIHNAWLAAARIDAVYVAFAPPRERFAAFAEGLRSGAVRGLNLTVPFKEQGLALADEASAAARRAGSANLLLFEPDGRICADNTDGVGLLAALAAQAPGFDPRHAPALILGAGGAARGAAAALLEAGAPEVRIINRTHARAEALAEAVGGLVRVFDEVDDRALCDVGLIVNATTLGLGGGAGPAVSLGAAPDSAVVMDMVYRPLRTEFLHRAAALGMRTADGLEMLIGQAVPSFAALFGVPPPAIDVRGLCLKALEEKA
ncbi:MAG: shikimate dehydrogenase [Caulobacteraceae bacterium]|nr:shikimate dehydrogenase [Caulobacteraceae bacterium]